MIKLRITAKPAAKEDKVEKLSDSHLKVWVKAPADEGRANEAVMKTVAEYLGVPKSALKMVSGRKSKEKILSLG